MNNVTATGKVTKGAVNVTAHTFKPGRHRPENATTANNRRGWCQICGRAKAAHFTGGN